MVDIFAELALIRILQTTLRRAKRLWNQSFKVSLELATTVAAPRLPAELSKFETDFAVAEVLSTEERALSACSLGFWLLCQRRRTSRE